MAQYINREGMNDLHLEPRVAKLETGLDILTRDVANLAQVVRDQGTGIERQIKDLAVGVTAAAAPKRTDWQTLIALAMLVMAIGSAVFWPLNQTAQNNKAEIQAVQQKFDNHTQLQLHPVGQALLQRVEDQFKIHQEQNDKDMTAHDAMDRREFDALDRKLQVEFTLANKVIEQKQVELERLIQAVNDKQCQRITAVEKKMEYQDQNDLIELRAWRNKASGLLSPEQVVPLAPRMVNPVTPVPGK